jgi:hypothetical protein
MNRMEGLFVLLYEGNLTFLERLLPVLYVGYKELQVVLGIDKCVVGDFMLNDLGMLADQT